jgi:hypothetical protein
MFKKLMEKLKSLANARKAFDPSRFGDPIAMQIEWTPTRGNMANSWTREMHKWVEMDPARMEFRTDAKFAGFMVMIFGIVLGAVIFLHEGKSFSAGLLFGLVIMVFGGCWFYFGTVRIVFDKSKGIFWKGRKEPDEVGDKNELKCFGKLGDIYALQLISTYNEETNSYLDCQLNLVLKDGSRIQVLEDRKRNKIREFSQTLSTFLGKPVWDAT